MLWLISHNVLNVLYRQISLVAISVIFALMLGLTFR